MKRITVVLMVLVCAGGVLFAEETPVRISWFAPLSLQMPLIAREKGFDREFGIKFEMVRITRASEAMQALLTGNLDITFGPFLAAETAVASGAEVKGIIIAYYGGYKSALVALEKSGIKEVKDLSGKTIAVPGLGAPPELFVRMAAEMAGLAPDSYRLVQQALDMIPAALATNQVDAAMLFEPLLTRFLAEQKDARILLRGTSVPEVNYVPTGYWLPAERIAKDPELVYRIYLALAKSQWWIRTRGADSDEVLAIVAGAANMPAGVFKPSAKQNIWDPRIKPVQVANIEEEMKFFYELGNLKQMVSVPDMWDNSYYERALKEHPELFSDLGQYMKELERIEIVSRPDYAVGLR